MSIIRLIIPTSFFLCFFFILEIFKRKVKIHAEYTRKIAHLCTGLAAILFSYWLKANEFILVTSIFFVFFLVARSKKFLKAINIHHRITYGEVTYPLGLIVLSLNLYQLKKIFITGVLILAVPDAIAGIAGFKLQKKRKSLIGSLIYFLVALVILCLNPNLKNSVLLAFILTLVEFISPWGLDNFTVPLIYSLLP